MKITSEILKKQSKGSTITYKVDTPRDLFTARSLANYVSRSYPELGVKFATKVNFSTNEITISANAVKKSK